MESRLTTAQEAAIGFARTLRAAGSGGSHRLRQPRHHPADLHERRRTARAGDPQDVGRRVHVDVQRDLHRAEGPEEGRRHERRGDPPPGDRRAVRRRGHVEPAAVRGSARSREAVRDGDLRHRPPLGRGFGGRAGIQGGGVRAAPARAGDRRPRLLPERGRRARRRSTSRSRTSCRASTRSATPRAIRSATARGAASSSASTGRSTAARTKQGYFGPTVSRTAMNVVPLALYAAALVAYALHFARRQAAGRPRGDHPARRRRAGAHLRHRHADDGGRPRAGCRTPASAISTFVLAAGARLSLRRDDDRRAGDGRVHPAAAGRAPGDSGAQPGASRSAPRCSQGPLFGLHVSSLLFAYASFALACVIGITYVLLFKEIKAKHLGFFYARLPSLQVLDSMNQRPSSSAGSSSPSGS